VTERIRWSGQTLGAPASHCDGQVCITCSDEAVPVRILELLADGLAIADVGGDAPAEEVSVALVDAAVGDTVLVHAKEAIAVVSRAGRDGA
jgi:hydrogenase expression/formation protein HypC